MASIFGQVHVDPQGILAHAAPGLAGALEQRTARGCVLAWTGARAAASNGPLHIVADARLDDRANLASSVGLNPDRASDAEVILAAYQHHGVDGLATLFGDFAVAIWDDSRRELLCARDVFGVMPFYYRHDRNGLAFGSQLPSLRRERDAMNTRHLAAYLTGLDDSAEDTIFAPIRRLPPGHVLLWRRGELIVRRYTAIAPAATGPGKDYPAEIRRRFLDSVQDRSLGPGRVGALLSGGLDSSSIVAAAARRREARLPTFSFAYPTGSPYDENDFVRAMIECYPLAPEFVAMREFAPLDGLAALASGADDLIFGPGLLKVGRLLDRARKVGVRIVLDGHGGDEVISHGYGRLKELARQRRWRTLYRELRGVSALTQDSALGLLMRFLASEGLVARLRRRAAPGSHETTDTPILDRDLARAADIEDRTADWVHAYRRAAASEATLHTWNVSSPSVASAFEALRRVADASGVTVRFPFYDRRLVSYALAVPDAEKLRDGWTRRVMREAMEGLLPERVRWRRTKTDFSHELTEGMARDHGPYLADILRKSGPLAGLVDLPSARQRLQTLLANPRAAPTADVLALWRMAFLAMWLDNGAKARKPEMAMS